MFNRELPEAKTTFSPPVAVTVGYHVFDLRDADLRVRTLAFARGYIVGPHTLFVTKTTLGPGMRVQIYLDLPSGQCVETFGDVTVAHIATIEGKMRIGVLVEMRQLSPSAQMAIEACACERAMIEASTRKARLTRMRAARLFRLGVSENRMATPPAGAMTDFDREWTRGL